MFHPFKGKCIHSVAFGNGAETVVAIPGSIANWEVWLPTLEVLANGHSVVAIDHAGVGQSKVSADEISFDLQIELLEAVVESRGLVRFVLLGDSSNVAVALEFALRNRSAVGALVLTAGVPWAFDTPEVRRFVDAIKEDFDGTTARFAKACFPEHNSEHLAEWLRDMIIRTGPAGVVAILESYYPIDLRDRLDQINVPCLVLGGSDDRIASEGLSGLRGLADSLPDSELAIIEGAGHVPSMSRPAEMAKLIASFIGRRMT